MLGFLNENMIISLTFGVVSFVVFLLTFGVYWWRQRMKLSLVLVRAILVGITIGVMYYQISALDVGYYNFAPFSYIGRVSELGYKAIWGNIASVGAPMMATGILLPLAYWKVNKLSVAAIVALIMTAIYSVLCLVLGGFDIDNAIYFFWGIIAGYALITFIAGLVPKLKLFAQVGFKNNQYIIGCLILMCTFFFGIAIFLMDNAVKILPLQFGGSQPLPGSENIVMSASLGDTNEKAMVYVFEKPDLSVDAGRIAGIIGLNSTAVIDEKTNSFAEVKEGSKSFVLYSAGNWTFSDEDAKSSDGSLANDEDADRIARQIANNGAIRGYEVYSVEVVPTNEGDTEKTVYVYPQIDGAEIISSCELKIILGANGRPISIQKFDSELKEYKKKKVISSSDAYDIIMNDGADSKGNAWPMYHNLYDKAVNINITDVNKAYWMEGTQGQLHPVWKFDAMATLVDGGTTKFQIYVAAIDY